MARPRSATDRVVAQVAQEPDPAAALEAARREVLTLRAGLETRTVIGQAIGITMVRHGMSTEDALAHLVGLSQRSNVKVRDVARRLVDEADAEAGEGPCSTDTVGG